MKIIRKMLSRKKKKKLKDIKCSVDAFEYINKIQKEIKNLKIVSNKWIKWYVYIRIIVFYFYLFFYKIKIFFSGWFCKYIKFNL